MALRFGGDQALFSGSQAEHLKVTIPGGSWELAAIPSGGWYTQDPRWILVFGSMLSLVFCVIVVALFTSKDKLIHLNQELAVYLKLVDEYVIMSSADLAGNITYASEAFCQISGYSSKELQGKNYEDIKHDEMSPDAFIAIRTAIQSGITWEGELRFRAKNGSSFWVQTRITPRANGEKTMWCTAVMKDITSQKRAESLSITDEMTGLFNRRYFNRIFSSERDRAKRNNHSLSFLMLDVDCFKQYNDYYGHQAGDAVLASVGKMLNQTLERASDLAFRLGGEEFGVIISGVERQKVAWFAEELLKELQALSIPHDKNTAAPIVTMSAGLVTYTPAEIPSLEEIYRKADEALYKAKHLGRNRLICV